MLLKDALRCPFEGIGKPEPLRFELSGAGSRRIDEANQLLYTVDDDCPTVLFARDHY